MKITAEFTTSQEILEFAKLFVGGATSNEIPNIKVEGPLAAKEIDKVVKEDCKKNTKVKETKEDAKVEEQPKQEEVNTETTQEDNEAVTKEMVRDIFSKLLKSGKQSEAKELTSKYGASKIPEIKEEDYAAIYKDAKELIG